MTRPKRLDNNLGIEHIYLVFSSDPWSDLEDALRRYDAATSPTATTLVDANMKDANPNRLSFAQYGWDPT